MKLTMSAWPILFVSHELNAENDNGFRLREIIHELENTQQCKVIRSFTYEDAAEIFLSRADLSTIVLDWDLPLEDAAEKGEASGETDSHVQQRLDGAVEPVDQRHGDGYPAHRETGIKS